MEQQIVIMIDGTNCGGLFGGTTNVCKLRSIACENRFQHCEYISGPGCVPRDKLKRMLAHCDFKRMRRAVRRTIHGLLWGGDMTNILVNGYSRLAEWYGGRFDDNATPRIFIFGFSRGACIARKLCEMITVCGVPSNGKFAKKVVEDYRKKHIKAINDLRKEGKLSKPVDVTFLGLWDSVNASLRTFKVGKDATPGIQKCRHSLAKHEYRLFFRHQMLSGRNVESLIFPGCHGDIGGGYEDSGILSNMAFDWVIEDAVNKGVLISSEYDRSQTYDIGQANIHYTQDDITNLMGLLGYYKREFRKIPEHRLCTSIETTPTNLQTLEKINANIKESETKIWLRPCYRSRSIRLYLKFTKKLQSFIESSNVEMII